MSTSLEELLADISSVARRPSEARVAVQPPVAREIEISDQDVVEEVEAPQPKRLARGTEPAASEAGLREVGLINLEPMRSAEYAEMAVAAQPAERRKQRRWRNAIGALMLVTGAAVGAGAMALWPAAKPDAPARTTEPAPVEVAAATPVQAPDSEEYVAVDELEPAEPAEIELDLPVMEIKPRAAAARDGEPATPPAPLSLEVPCYEPACAAMDAEAETETETETEADTETETETEAETDTDADTETAAAAETAPAVAAPVDPRALPAHPHASAIGNAIVAVQDQLDGCGDAFGTRGAVRIRLRIAPAGSVETVTVLDGNAGFRTCVADAVRRIRVHASTLGTTETLAVRVR